MVLADVSNALHELPTHVCTETKNYKNQNQNLILAYFRLLIIANIILNANHNKEIINQKKCSELL